MCAIHQAFQLGYNGIYFGGQVQKTDDSIDNIYKSLCISVKYKLCQGGCVKFNTTQNFGNGGTAGNYQFTSHYVSVHVIPEQL